MNINEPWLTPVVVVQSDLDQLSSHPGPLFVLPVTDQAAPSPGDRVIVVTWTRTWRAGWFDGVAEVLDTSDEGEILIQWAGSGIIDIRPEREVVKLVDVAPVGLG